MPLPFYPSAFQDGASGGWSAPMESNTVAAAAPSREAATGQHCERASLLPPEKYHSQPQKSPLHTQRVLPVAKVQCIQSLEPSRSSMVSTEGKGGATAAAAVGAPPLPPRFPPSSPQAVTQTASLYFTRGAVPCDDRYVRGGLQASNRRGEATITSTTIPLRSTTATVTASSSSSSSSAAEANTAQPQRRNPPAEESAFRSAASVQISIVDHFNSSPINTSSPCLLNSTDPQSEAAANRETDGVVINTAAPGVARTPPTTTATAAKFNVVVVPSYSLPPQHRASFSRRWTPDDTSDSAQQEVADGVSAYGVSRHHQSSSLGAVKWTASPLLHSSGTSSCTMDRASSSYSLHYPGSSTAATGGWRQWIRHRVTRGDGAATANPASHSFSSSPLPRFAAGAGGQPSSGSGSSGFAAAEMEKRYAAGILVEGSSDADAGSHRRTRSSASCTDGEGGPQTTKQGDDAEAAEAAGRRASTIAFLRRYYNSIVSLDVGPPSTFSTTAFNATALSRETRLAALWNDTRQTAVLQTAWHLLQYTTSGVAALLSIKVLTGVLSLFGLEVAEAMPPFDSTNGESATSILQRQIFRFGGYHRCSRDGSGGVAGSSAEELRLRTRRRRWLQAASRSVASLFAGSNHSSPTMQWLLHLLLSPTAAESPRRPSVLGKINRHEKRRSSQTWKSLMIGCARNQSPAELAALESCDGGGDKQDDGLMTHLWLYLLHAMSVATVTADGAVYEQQRRWSPSVSSSIVSEQCDYSWGCSGNSQRHPSSGGACCGTRSGAAKLYDGARSSETRSNGSSNQRVGYAMEGCGDGDVAPHGYTPPGCFTQLLSSSTAAYEEAAELLQTFLALATPLMSIIAYSTVTGAADFDRRWWRSMTLFLTSTGGAPSRLSCLLTFLSSIVGEMLPTHISALFSHPLQPPWLMEQLRMSRIRWSSRPGHQSDSALHLSIGGTDQTPMRGLLIHSLHFLLMLTFSSPAAVTDAILQHTGFMAAIIAHVQATSHGRYLKLGLAGYSQTTAATADPEAVAVAATEEELLHFLSLRLLCGVLDKGEAGESAALHGALASWALGAMAMAMQRGNHCLEKLIFLSGRSVPSSPHASRRQSAASPGAATAATPQQLPSEPPHGAAAGPAVESAGGKCCTAWPASRDHDEEDRVVARLYAVADTQRTLVYYFLSKWQQTAATAAAAEMQAVAIARLLSFKGPLAAARSCAARGSGSGGDSTAANQLPSATACGAPMKTSQRIAYHDFMGALSEHLSLLYRLASPSISRSTCESCGCDDFPAASLLESCPTALGRQYSNFHRAPTRSLAAVEAGGDPACGGFADGKDGHDASVVSHDLLAPFVAACAAESSENCPRGEAVSAMVADYLASVRALSRFHASSMVAQVSHCPSTLLSGGPQSAADASLDASQRLLRAFQLLRHVEQRCMDALTCGVLHEVMAADVKGDRIDDGTKADRRTGDCLSLRVPAASPPTPAAATSSGVGLSFMAACGREPTDMTTSVSCQLHYASVLSRYLIMMVPNYLNEDLDEDAAQSIEQALLCLLILLQTEEGQLADQSCATEAEAVTTDAEVSCTSWILLHNGVVALLPRIISRPARFSHLIPFLSIAILRLVLSSRCIPLGHTSELSGALSKTRYLLPSVLLLFNDSPWRLLIEEDDTLQLPGTAGASNEAPVERAKADATLQLSELIRREVAGSLTSALSHDRKMRSSALLRWQLPGLRSAAAELLHCWAQRQLSFYTSPATDGCNATSSISFADLHQRPRSSFSPGAAHVLLGASNFLWVVSRALKNAAAALQNFSAASADHLQWDEAELTMHFAAHIVRLLAVMVELDHGGGDQGSSDTAARRRPRREQQAWLVPLQDGLWALHRVQLSSAASDLSAATREAQLGQEWRQLRRTVVRLLNITVADSDEEADDCRHDGDDAAVSG